MRQQPRPSCHQKGHSVLGWLLKPQEMRARHIVHPWDPRWFLVHDFWSHSLAGRAAAQLQRKQEAALTHPPHITSPWRAQISHPAQNWEFFPGGKAWSSEGAAGTSPCSSPAGLTATLEPPRGCLLLLLPKLQQNRWEWHARKAGLGFVLFCFFQEVFYGRGKKALERQGECHGAPPQWILMGFPTFERDRNTV